MKGPRSEKLRLLHMRDAADRILLEYGKLNGEQLADDDLRYMGLLRLMEIIGEAAYKLTRELRTRKYPGGRLSPPAILLCTSTMMWTKAAFGM